MTERMETYDVIVAGGGTAGVIAAIAAARAGAATLLIEKTGMLGGTVTTGGISNPASFSAWHTPVIAGIGWELCCRALKETGEIPPDPAAAEFPGKAAGRLAMHVNPAMYAAVADEMIRESGASVLFHTMPAAVQKDGQWHITVCTKTGLRDLTANVLVDCTGDANLVALAGYELDQDPEPQPATLFAKLGGYDAKSIDYDALQQAFEKEVAAGRMKRSDPGWAHGQVAFFFNSYGGNRIHVLHGTDVHTSEGKSTVEMEARRILLNLVRFGRRQPGMENLTVSYCCPECAIRETKKIKGKKYITVSDYETGKQWEDAVCYSFYPIDVHRSEDTIHRGIPEHVYPTIPLGAMLPEGSRDLIVAGRTVAGDKEAHSAYRVESSCMAMGHAAGAAAALVAQTGRDFTDLALPELYALLEKEGAIVPGKING